MRDTGSEAFLRAWEGPNNGSQAAPPSGAPDGDPPPLEPTQTPGCLSQYLDEPREVIHQCARDVDHPGVHLSRVTRDPSMIFPDCVMWHDEHALGYVPPAMPFRDETWGTDDPAALYARLRGASSSFRYLHADLWVNDPKAFTKVTGL